MGAWREGFDEMLGRFFGDARDSWWTGDIAAPVDLAETDNGFEVRMDMPGMAAKDFDIQVNGNVVTISGERKEETEEKGKTWHRVERRSGSFSRSVTLPCNINAHEVAADYTGGVLTVTLPKADEAKPRRVTVKG
jgi:HSP20 family protein